MVYIQVPDMNDSFSRLALGGNEYLIRFSYNSTGEYWTFGIYKAKKTPIITGIKIVPCFPLNRYFQDEGMPDGVFGVITKQDRVVRKSFVSGDAKFVFIPTDELSQEAKLYV